MKNLKELISTIEEKRAEAAVIPEDADPRVRGGVEAVVRNAKKDLEPLEAEYREEVIASAVVIAIKGDGAKDFADTARIVFDTTVVDYDLALNRIKKSVKDRSGRTEFSTQEFFMVLDELNKMKVEYSMLALPAPKVNPAVDRVYGIGIDEAIENIIKVNYEEQLSSAITRREIGKLALDLKFTGKHLPVVLYNYHGALSEEHLPRPIATVSVTKKEVTKDFVKEVLTQVKNRITGNSPARSRKKTVTAKEAPAAVAEATTAEQQTEN